MTSDHDTGHDTGAAPTPAATITALTAQNTLLHRRLLELDSRLDDLAESFDLLEETLTTAASHDSSSSDSSTDSSTAGTEDSPTSTATEDPTTAPTTAGSADGPTMRVLLPWVRHTIAERCERKLPQSQGRIRWCRAWWHHPEAVARFAALHQAWTEATAPDPETETGTALVTYYTHLDHTLEVLMSEHGPFSACPGGRHRTPGTGDPTVGYLGQDRHPDEPDPSEEKEP